MPSPSVRMVLRSGLQAETNTLLAAMTPQPSAARRSDIDRLIIALKSAYVWSKFDTFYVMGAQTSQAALLNWINPGTNTLNPVNSPTFTADRGYAGDGTTSYLDTLLAHNACTKLTQNSCHIGVLTLTAGTSARSIAGGTTSKIRIRTNTGTGASGIANAATGINITDGSTFGHVVATRRDSANQWLYRNGGQEVTGAQASVAPDATTLTFGKDSGTFSGAQIFAGHFGALLSAADVLAIYNAINAYKTAAGA